MGKDSFFGRTFKLVDEANYFDTLKTLGYPALTKEGLHLQITEEENGFIRQNLTSEGGSISQSFKLGEFTEEEGEGGKLTTKISLERNKLTTKLSGKKGDIEFEYELNGDKIAASVSYSRVKEDGTQEAGNGVANFEEVKE